MPGLGKRKERRFNTDSRAAFWAFGNYVWKGRGGKRGRISAGSLLNPLSVAATPTVGAPCLDARGESFSNEALDVELGRRVAKPEPLLDSRIASNRLRDFPGSFVSFCASVWSKVYRLLSRSPLRRCRSVRGAYSGLCGGLNRGMGTPKIGWVRPLGLFVLSSH